jgi:rhodanese-related sulfurtransferase
VSSFDVPTVGVDGVPDGAALLDVREDDEWAAGHIEGAMHIPMYDVPTVLADDPGPLVPGRQIVVICAVGARSAQVTAWLIRQGYDAVNLSGGMHAWADAGQPMISESDAPPTVL